MQLKSYLLLPLLLAGALIMTTAASASGKTTIRVGKTADLTFAHATKVGDAMLQPGDYTVRYHAVGNNHFLVFQRWEEGYDEETVDNVGKPIHVKCRIDPLGSKVSQTTVIVTRDGNFDKVTKIEIAGENVEHLF